MNQTVKAGDGELKVDVSKETVGKVTFEELGVETDQIQVDGGFLRIVFDFGQFSQENFYAVPTVEIAYDINVAETHWQCDFNGETILDKLDNHGNSTVILLNRDKMVNQLHHHNNNLVVHGEFPEAVKVDLSKSYIHLVK